MHTRLGIMPILVYLVSPIGVFFALSPLDDTIPALNLFLKLLILGWFLILLSVWFFNKIDLNGNILIIRSHLSFPYLDSWLVKDHPQTSRYRVIDINNIKEIKIVTTTPLIPMRENISEINWRDKVEIYYQYNNQSNNVAKVELFIFPGFKKILQEILSEKPNIEIFYTKLTGIQNLTQPKNPDYE